MNLNEQLQEAYEAGRRQALDEQYQAWTPPPVIDNFAGVRPGDAIHGGDPYKLWKKHDFWREFMRLRRLGDISEARYMLKVMVRRGLISQAGASQLMTALAEVAAGTMSQAALSSLLATLGLSAAIIAIIVGAIVAPGFGGLTTISPNIPQGTLQARYPQNYSPTGVGGQYGHGMPQTPLDKPRH